MTAAGTIGFDDLTTPSGRATEVPGGSALYFSLAARQACPVLPLGVLGEDGSTLRELMVKAKLETQGIELRPGPSYRWTAVHSQHSSPEREVQRFGVYEGWRPTVPADARSSEILFLGSMHPTTQLFVLGQCTGANLVALDTMRDFIRSDRGLLLELARDADLLFANRGELEELTQSPALEGARSLIGSGRLRAVVVKEGARGAVLLTRGMEKQFPAHPVREVVDPTGAGDSLAGGLLGHLASVGSSSETALVHGMEAGLRAAALAVSAFGPAALVQGGQG